MNLLTYKGKRIRASDKYLVYRFCAGTLLSLFLLVLMLLTWDSSCVPIGSISAC